MLLDGRVDSGEENAGPPGLARFRARQVARQQKSIECLFVNPGEVERFKATGNGLAAQTPRRCQAGVTILAQVFAQRGQIALRELEDG